MGRESWKCVMVSRAELDAVKAAMQEQSRSPATLPDAAVVRAGLNSLRLEMRGELYRFDDMKAVVQANALALVQKGVQTMIAELVARGFHVQVGMDGELIFSEPAKAGGQEGRA